MINETITPRRCEHTAAILATRDNALRAGLTIVEVKPTGVIAADRWFPDEGARVIQSNWNAAQDRKNPEALDD